VSAGLFGASGVKTNMMDFNSESGMCLGLHRSDLL